MFKESHQIYFQLKIGMRFYCKVTTHFQFGYYWPNTNFNSKHCLKLGQIRFHEGEVGLYLFQVL